MLGVIFKQFSLLDEPGFKLGIFADNSVEFAFELRS